MEKVIIYVSSNNGFIHLFTTERVALEFVQRNFNSNQILELETFINSKTHLRAIEEEKELTNSWEQDTNEEIGLDELAENPELEFNTKIISYTTGRNDFLTSIQPSMIGSVHSVMVTSDGTLTNIIYG